MSAWAWLVAGILLVALVGVWVLYGLLADDEDDYDAAIRGSDPWWL